MSTTTESASTSELEFPFRVVTDVELAFPALDDFEQVLAACPPKFLSGEESDWLNAASRLIVLDGWTPERQKIACELFITDNAEVARNQIRYVSAWMGSFQPRHQQKESVVAWLLSLMFTECPNW